MEENWGSLVSEYAEQVVDENEVGRRHSPKRGSRHLARQNAAYSDHTQQVFIHGVVFPMQRAPPGFTAQESESRVWKHESKLLGGGFSSGSKPLNTTLSPVTTCPCIPRERERGRVISNVHIMTCANSDIQVSRASRRVAILTILGHFRFDAPRTCQMSKRGNALATHVTGDFIVATLRHRKHRVEDTHLPPTHTCTMTSSTDSSIIVQNRLPGATVTKGRVEDRNHPRDRRGKPLSSTDA